MLDLVQPGKTSKDLQVAVAAMAGAYGAVCWYLIARMQQRNLSRGDVCRAAIQLALAVLAGFAFSAFSNADLAPLMAFAVGFIPFQTLAELLRKQVRKQLPATADAAPSGEQITELTGIDAATAARIEDADITTVGQLAWCDPIELTMRSNLPFIFVLDVVSQALAWVYLKGSLKPLEKVGLRGAIEIRTTLRLLQSDNGDKKTSAQSSLDEASKIVQVNNSALRRAFYDIAEDPFTTFLEEIWQSFRDRVK
jgi:predicted DNA-binding antitoxin AbrB/MazE fold protein